MKKIIEWLKYSNNWKHLVACLLISIVCGFIPAMLVGIAVEIKDKSWGGQFDWSDIRTDLLGACIGTIIRFIIFNDIHRILC